MMQQQQMVQQVMTQQPLPTAPPWQQPQQPNQQVQNLQQQIAQHQAMMEQQIKQSEQNLAAQYQSLIQQQQVSINVPEWVLRSFFPAFNSHPRGMSVFFSSPLLYDTGDLVLFDSIIDGIVLDSSYFETLNQFVIW